MAIKSKLIERFKSIPRDFAWDEQTTLLRSLGFEEKTQGKTTGSGRKFFNSGSRLVMNLHKPHPSQIIKTYMIKQIITKLREEGLI